MAGTKGFVKSRTKIRNASKRVKEEVVRYTTDAVINAGTRSEAYLLGGAAPYEVKIGECVELLELGIYPDVAINQTRVFDRDGSEWNRFYTPAEAAVPNGNQLPFNQKMNFERLQMSWGYKSFLSAYSDLAPTLKLAEGDRLRIDVQVGAAPTAVVSPIGGILRRYLPGSKVDYRHFNQTDGGLKSYKRFYNDYQTTATTVANVDTQLWQLPVLRNEAYKFFQGGIRADLDVSAAAMTSHLTQARIMIDDPKWRYNDYYANSHYNDLPFKTVSNIYVDPALLGPYSWSLDRIHRFAPTVDIVKNRNKDLTIYGRDDGTPATDIVTVMMGTKYEL